MKNFSDHKEQTLVSIGVPTYNGAKRIGKALNSIFRQNYQNVEIIISDNGSTDDTEAVCLSYVETDPRIKYFRHPENRGLSFNFEYVLQNASGQYFMWLSDDDEILPDVIGSYVQFMESNPDYSLVSGEIDYWEGTQFRDRERDFNFEGSTPLLRSFSFYAKVKEGAIIYGLMRRDIASQIRFKSILGCDWHFVAALAYQGKIKQLPFTGYNKYSGGISGNFRHYAKVVNEAPIWGFLPFTKIAIDAAKEISFVSPVFRKSPLLFRLPVAVLTAIVIWGHYNIVLRSRIFLGKLLRILKIRTPRQRKLDALSPAAKRS